MAKMAGCPMIALLVLVFGCAEETTPPNAATGPFLDFVALEDGAGARTFYFDDQTFLGLQLTPQHPRYVSDAKVLTRAQTLSVSGAYGAGALDPTEPGQIELTLISNEKVLWTAEKTLDPGQTWWSLQAELPTFPPSPAEVRVDAYLPAAHRVLIQELVVKNRPRREARPSPPPQILLISVDTLREDALGRFGGPWETPGVNWLAENAEVWTPHYAGGGWTKPSHATMLTGYRGDTHQVLDPEAVIPEGLPTLAERFRDGGFTTAGLVFACSWLDEKWGFNRGFDEYDVVVWRTRRSARRVANWIDRHRDDPFFLFYHSFEPHSDFVRLPYEAPGTNQASIEQEFGVPGYGCTGDLCASDRLEAINRGEVEPLDGEAAILRETYGRGVRATDAALSELFETLRAMGVWDDLLVVLTSDHGESFLEHGRVLHGSMWNEIVRVPLMVKWPRRERAGGRRAVPTSSIDIGPTLLTAAGLSTGDLPGSPLQTLSEHRPMYVYGGTRTIIDGARKVITSGDLTRCLFTADLAADPGETTDLTDTRPDVFDELRAIAKQLTGQDRHLRARHVTTGEAAEAPRLTEAEKRKLRALGYLQ